MRFLRRILNITRRDRIRNVIVREQLGVESLILSVERTQLVWFGHARRMPIERLVHQIMEAEPLESRPRGRPRTRWLDQQMELAQRIGIEYDQVRGAAADRIEWRRLVSTLQPRLDRIERFPENE